MSTSTNNGAKESHDAAKVTTPLLHQNLMFARKFVDPMRYYEIVAMLGEGSMGSVSKVKKRQEAVGGSARRSVLPHTNIIWKLQACWGWCLSGEDRNSYLNPRNIITVPGRDSKHSSDNLSASDEFSESSSMSSMIRFGNQQATYYALKSIHLAQARNHTLRQELKNEVEILKSLDHPVSVLLIRALVSLNSL
jgi:serine/threonine protein kinase